MVALLQRWQRPALTRRTDMPVVAVTSPVIAVPVCVLRDWTLMHSAVRRSESLDDVDTATTVRATVIPNRIRRAPLHMVTLMPVSGMDVVIRAIQNNEETVDVEVVDDHGLTDLTCLTALFYWPLRRLPPDIAARANR
jgi:hypothetical protein